MAYRDEVYFQAPAEPEVPFSEEEFAGRLQRIRTEMARAGIDCLFLTSPESLYYVSGFLCMWYQTESPMEWPPSNGIAVHVDHDRFIHFETEREAVLTRTFTVSRDTRFFPRESFRDGTRFIADELKAEGWLKGNVGLEFWAGRPNRAVSERFQAAFEAAGARVVDGSAILREAAARGLLRHDRDPLVRRRGCHARHRAGPLRACRYRVRPPLACPGSFGDWNVREYWRYRGRESGRRGSCRWYYARVRQSAADSANSVA